MRVINAMFGRGKGGIEQAFVDYTEALANQSNEVIAFIQPEAAIIPALEELNHPNVSVEMVRNFGMWDLAAILKLRKKIKEINPDIILTHGNRAAFLLKKAAGRKVPVVGLAHNYKVKRLIGLAAIFAITRHLHEFVTKKGQPAEKTFTVPNMIRLNKEIRKRKTKFHKTPVIGTMGRFVEKKGFDYFIRALSVLKEKSIPFEAVIGGGGPEAEYLKKLVLKLGLEGQVKFSGWVSDKRKFFESIDIFCLPSLHEPFGIVLLEAFSFSLPVVTTDSEGPSEIATHGKNALITPRKDENAMADALKTLIYDQTIAHKLGGNAFETVKTKYDMGIIGKKINDHLEKIIKSIAA